MFLPGPELTECSCRGLNRYNRDPAHWHAGRSQYEVAGSLGVLADPARARKPKDKPRVERQMPYIRDSLWKGREFTSLVEMQASALHWCREVAGQRKHRRLGGRTPRWCREGTE
jgi:hypothetical protein